MNKSIFKYSIFFLFFCTYEIFSQTAMSFGSVERHQQIIQELKDQNIKNCYAREMMTGQGISTVIYYTNRYNLSVPFFGIVGQWVQSINQFLDNLEQQGYYTIDIAYFSYPHGYGIRGNRNSIQERKESKRRQEETQRRYEKQKRRKEAKERAKKAEKRRKQEKLKKKRNANNQSNENNTWTIKYANVTPKKDKPQKIYIFIHRKDLSPSTDCRTWNYDRILDPWESATYKVSGSERLLIAWSYSSNACNWKQIMEYNGKQGTHIYEECM